MKVILRDGATVVLRFNPGEEVLGELKDLCEKENIRAASLAAIGSSSEVELAYYHLDTKQYESKSFGTMLEIVSMTGTVGRFGEETIVHAHGVFSDSEMTTRAGHINRLIVGATSEMTLTILSGVLEREYSDDIGLKLLK